MKKLCILFLCLFIFTITNAQSNKEIANVYINRAKEAIETNIDYKEALVQFEKAIKRVDTITDTYVASLASLIYYENHHYQATEKEQLIFLKKSEFYSKQYFLLEKNKALEEYTNNLENIILIQETIDEIKAKIKVKEEEHIRKEKELKKIDSLKTVWNKMSKTLSLSVDSIYAFNKNNFALYTKEGNFGIIDDKGIIHIEANTYKDAISAEGFILLKNTKEEASKIYCFNTSDKKGFLLPSISEFNALSTHYGKVMLPRENGRLVTYPNNSYKPMIYDLNVKKVVRVSNQKELLKSLKKDDVIDKYNNDGEVKIYKEWYYFGGSLGGGVYPLYNEENYNTYFFLCSVGKNVLSLETGYEYLGAFYDDKLQVIKKGEVFWINQEGVKVNSPKDNYKKYLGDSKVVRLEEGRYQIVRNDIIVIGDEKLEKLGAFLRKHKSN